MLKLWADENLKDIRIYQFLSAGKRLNDPLQK
jgi:hypothetical protein